MDEYLERLNQFVGNNYEALNYVGDMVTHPIGVASLFVSGIVGGIILGSKYRKRVEDKKKFAQFGKLCEARKALDDIDNSYDPNEIKNGIDRLVS